MLSLSLGGLNTAYAGKTKTLNVEVIGDGTVVSSPAGIDCVDQCSAGFPDKTLVSLTATAAEGYEFASWGGACAGSANTCQLTLERTAGFTRTAGFGMPILYDADGARVGRLMGMYQEIDLALNISLYHPGRRIMSVLLESGHYMEFAAWTGNVVDERTINYPVSYKIYLNSDCSGSEMAAYTYSGSQAAPVQLTDWAFDAIVDGQKGLFVAKDGIAYTPSETYRLYDDGRCVGNPHDSQAWMEVAKVKDN